MLPSALAQAPALAVPPRPWHVVFLACNKNPARFAEDGSFIYRCQNLAEALRRAGHRVTLTHHRLWQPQTPADVIVFHRPRLTWRLRWLLWQLRHHRARLVADVDDLIFLPELAPLSPGVLNGVAQVRAIRAQFAAHQAALARFTHISASTQPLLRELAAWRPQGEQGLHWLPNAVHLAWRDLAEAPAWAERAAGGAGTTGGVIRYLPGTRSHDRDFAHIAPVLQACLRARPGWRLEIVGPLAWQLDVPAAQVLHRPRLPFARYHEAVQGAQLNLAPLEDTRFARCKSAIKVIEAAYWGVPTLCTPLEDAQRLRHAGALLADSPADWAAQLARACDDPAWLHAQAQDLRQRILPHADIHALAQGWLAWLGAAEAAPPLAPPVSFNPGPAQNPPEGEGASDEGQGEGRTA